MSEHRYTDDHYRRPLTERWNVAMTRAGFAGSEWIDEPERVAQKISDMKDELLQLRLEKATGPVAPDPASPELPPTLRGEESSSEWEPTSS